MLAERCGGCDWLHIEAAAALEFKVGIQLEALQRAGLSELPPCVSHVSPAGRPARARARFHLTGQGQVGFLGARSHQVVPVQACPALRPGLSSRVPDLTAAASEAAVRETAGPSPVQLMAAVDDRGRVIATPLDGRGRGLRGGPRGRLARALEARGIECAGPDDGAAPLVFDGPGLEQHAVAGGFFQANPEANQDLVRRVLALAGAGPGRAVDYFSGAGNLGLPLALAGWQVQGFELDRAAVALGNRRAAELGLQASCSVADLERDPPAPHGAALAVLDPTRRGARALARVLAASRVARVLHVGCDPATMARDAAVLAEGGYRLEALELFDFFPGTHHAEALGLWVWGAGGKRA